MDLSRPTSQNIKEAQCFLGFANFYRHFLSRLSGQITPLTTLLPKNTFTRSPEAQQAFDQLNVTFINTQILALTDSAGPFVIKTDISNVAIRAILAQRHGSSHYLLPCAYYLWKLMPAKQNYKILDKELLAIKAAFKEWCHYLEGAQYRVMVYTAHNFTKPR